MAQDDLDPNDLPQAPALPVTDADLEAASAQVASLDDDQLVKKIGRRTTTFGTVVGLTLVVAIGALAFVWYQRNQAYEHRWDFRPIAQEAESEEAFCTALRTELPETQFDDVRMWIMVKLGQYHDTNAVPLLIPYLDSPGRLRYHSSRALARIGSPAADAARPALLRVLPESDERDRAAVVWAMAVLGESNDDAVTAIIEEFEAGRLQVQPGFDPRIIVEVVGVTRLSTPELTAHESTGVRTLVAQALAEDGTTAVVDPLSRMLQDEDQNILRIAAAGLGRIGDPRAARPLFDLMQSDAQMRTTVMEALRRSTGASGLIVLLSSAGDVETKRQLASMLRATHDPAAADALAGLLSSEDEDTRIEAAHGLAELGDERCIPFLVQLAQDPNLTRGRDALDSLLHVPSPAVADALVPMLADEAMLGRRSSVMRVLGHSGSPAAVTAIMRQLEGDDVSAAALALADLDSDEAYRQLLRGIPRPRDVDFSAYMGMAGVPHEMEYNNRTAAVRAIGRFGRPDAAEILMTIIEDPQDDIRLRNDAGLALGAIATEDILRTVLQKVQQTDLDEAARRYYLGALWQRPSRALAGSLLDLVENPATPPDVRRPAAVAVGYAADPANDARLIALLENPDLARYAAIAICLGGSDAAGAALAEHLQSDGELRTILQETLMNTENDWFNLVTTDLWESGQLARRISVASILDANGSGWAWAPLMTRLVAGWDGHNGLGEHQIRARIYGWLTGDDDSVRAEAAHVLGSMNELGLLMAARDGGGPGADEARAMLRSLNRTAGDSDSSAASDAEDEIPEE